MAISLARSHQYDGIGLLAVEDTRYLSSSANLRRSLAGNFVLLVD